MTPTITLRKALMDLFAADPSTLAPAANANKMALVKNDVAENENIVFANLELADFDGSTPINGVVGAQETATDPASGESVITLKEPAGGWRWETTGVTNLPQTIYGVALVDNAVGVLLAYARLATPITLTATGQLIDLGKENITLQMGSLY